MTCAMQNYCGLASGNSLCARADDTGAFTHTLGRIDAKRHDAHATRMSQRDTKVIAAKLATQLSHKSTPYNKAAAYTKRQVHAVQRLSQNDTGPGVVFGMPF